MSNIPDPTDKALAYLIECQLRNNREIWPDDFIRRGQEIVAALVGKPAPAVKADAPALFPDRSRV